MIIFLVLHSPFLPSRLFQRDLSVARVFEAIETKKGSLGVLDYSVSQTSLEQIFNMFASQQTEETVLAPGIQQQQQTQTQSTAAVATSQSHVVPMIELQSRPPV